MGWANERRKKRRRCFSFCLLFLLLLASTLLSFFLPRLLLLLLAGVRSVNTVSEATATATASRGGSLHAFLPPPPPSSPVQSQSQSSGLPLTSLLSPSFLSFFLGGSSSSSSSSSPASSFLPSFLSSTDVNVTKAAQRRRSCRCRYKARDGHGTDFFRPGQGWTKNIFVSYVIFTYCRKKLLQPDRYM